MQLSERITSNLSRLYALRILIDLSVCQDLFPSEGRLGSRSTRVAKALGLLNVKVDEFRNPANDDFDDIEHTAVRVNKKLQPLVRKAHRDLEREFQKYKRMAPIDWYPGYLHQNLMGLQRLIGLSNLEVEVLTFVVLLHGDSLINRCANPLDEVSVYLIFDYISRVLHIPEDSVREALSPEGLLLSSGILSMSTDRFARSLEDYVQPLSASFVHCMIDVPCKHVEMFKADWRPAPAPTLSESDYVHIAGRVKGLTDYLRHVYAQSRNGCNVLIYGPPGTGKSELARLVGKNLGMSVMEVSCETAEGAPTLGEARLRSLRSAQVVLARQRALLVFDEVEDIFGYLGKSFSPFTKQPPKGWINRSLEECQVPTIWISNSVRSMDPAFIRRFDLVIQVDNPPERARRETAIHALSQYVDCKTLRAAACHPRLSPAIIQRSTKVIEALARTSDVQDFTAYWSDQVNQTLIAQGFNPLPKQSNVGPFERFDLSLINTTGDLLALMQSLSKDPRGRILLYGPPGTGKTAYCKWLAEQLDMALLLVKASDLLGKYVGETEAQIANVFDEASRTNSILMFDEVDSFLQERQSAQRSWEVTAVNEFLTQTESYDGLLIASTNLSEALDQAAYRRFDLKLKFGFLTKAQLVLALRRAAEILGLEAEQSDEELIHLIDRIKLNECTPGDLAALLRQSRFSPMTSISELLLRLADDLKLRSKGASSIGF